MEQQEILSLLDSTNNMEKINNISKIHLLTKHYLLLAEELSEDGVSFLQPLKEHRDAYDHLMRIFILAVRDDISKIDPVSYVEDNLKKAYGHEYRAFFDTADWLTFICRKYIRETLSVRIVKEKYQKQYEDYDELKDFINDLPQKIAEYREKKDVSSTELIAEVLEYQKTLDKLLSYYSTVRSIL